MDFIRSDMPSFEGCMLRVLSDLLGGSRRSQLQRGERGTAHYIVRLLPELAKNDPEKAQMIAKALYGNAVLPQGVHESTVYSALEGIFWLARFIEQESRATMEAGIVRHKQKTGQRGFPQKMPGFRRSLILKKLR